MSFPKFLIPSDITQGRLRCYVKITMLSLLQVHTPCHQRSHLRLLLTEMGLRGNWVNAHMPLWIAQ